MVVEKAALREDAIQSVQPVFRLRVVQLDNAESRPMRPSCDADDQDAMANCD